MPTDDLKFYDGSNKDQHGKDRGRMPPPKDEKLDCAGVVEEFINRAANLHNEITFGQDEITEKDRRYNIILHTISQKDASLQKWIKINGSHEQNPKEETLRKQIRELYDQADILSAQKLVLAGKNRELMDRHLKWLDESIEDLQERGEFPNDPDLPSVLNLQPQKQTSRSESSIGALPLNQIANPSAAPHQRHPTQQPLRVFPPQVQTQNLPGSTTSSSAPATPAATILNQQRRESSLGAGPKRQRTAGPTPSSALARHPSMTPGTPRGQTPTTGVRQSSIGPRASQKTTVGNKKVAPLGSRQSGVPRKKIPKSGLSRVKRTGNKNSPSSTNGSELSDAESDSGDDDGSRSPLKGEKDADGDEEMADGDDDEGADNKKYCTCQNVSYGNMVACDNDDCPYEWFHWSCVGLKSEPVGIWICPVCTKNKKLKENR